MMHDDQFLDLTEIAKQKEKTNNDDALELYIQNEEMQKQTHEMPGD